MIYANNCLPLNECVFGSGIEYDGAHVHLRLTVKVGRTKERKRKREEIVCIFYMHRETGRMEFDGLMVRYVSVVDCVSFLLLINWFKIKKNTGSNIRNSSLNMK